MISSQLQFFPYRLPRAVESLRELCDRDTLVIEPESFLDFASRHLDRPTFNTKAIQPMMNCPFGYLEFSSDVGWPASSLV